MDDRKEGIAKVGIWYVCTGRYRRFWQAFFSSCERFFLPECEKYYFIFSDRPIKELPPSATYIYQKKLGWPYDTLMRYHFFVAQEALVQDMDYLFFFNANCRFRERIHASECLHLPADLMAVSHFELDRKARQYFMYEENPLSTAYVYPHQGEHYVLGGINGGTRDAFMKMSRTLAKQIDMDLANGIMARCHDESHFNQYLVGRNVNILDARYGYPEAYPQESDAKILILDKRKYGGHAYLRGNVWSTYWAKLKTKLKTWFRGFR